MTTEAVSVEHWLGIEPRNAAIPVSAFFPPVQTSLCRQSIFLWMIAASAGPVKMLDALVADTLKAGRDA